MTKTIEKLYLASVFNQKTFVYYLFLCVCVLFSVSAHFTCTIWTHELHIKHLARLLRCDFWVLLCLFYWVWRRYFVILWIFSHEQKSSMRVLADNNTYGTRKCINNYKGIRNLGTFSLNTRAEVVLWCFFSVFVIKLTVWC